MQLDESDEASIIDGNNEPPQRRKAGRPRGSTKLKPTEELIRQISGLARIQCTRREAAAVIGVHYDTFNDFLTAHQKAKAAWEDGVEMGKASLRRNQYRMSEHNPTMAIWLGKQWLGQKDNLHLGNDPDSPLAVVHSILGTFDGTTRGLPGAAASGDDGEDVR